MMPRVLLGLLALLACAPAAAKDFPWPGERKAAIVLTYDDAMQSHLDNAIPQLDAAGLNGTFFLNVRFDEKGVPRWRAAAAKGHELANHTIFHPCPAGSFPMEKRYESETYSVKGMLAEIAAMNVLLHAIDGKTGRTFATPCGQAVAQGGDYTEALKAAGTIKYVRGPIFADAVIEDPRILDTMRVPSSAFDEKSGAADLIAFAEKIERSGGMGVVLFHGVGGDWLTVSNAVHSDFLSYLKRREKQLWVAPFQTVMDHVTAVKATRP
jgi:peptidoglycan/xylan/chitin deacetylase (PgdA/CDA1 family)